ncbi:uncharacterized protein LOC142978223 [Anticarsia gemmatalis]|uniref:uncharacterized protein LOC142978223 n=1 Tax=Anticarsia gemmatalis TaxID=129554 RepID=UPI003F76B24F
MNVWNVDMEEDTDHNKIFDDIAEPEEIEFKYNFINEPWDDRTTKRKIYVVVLLVAIFVTTMGLIFNNFYMHYKDFVSVKSYENTQINCFKIKMDELPYIARLYSTQHTKLLCLGAVISRTSVLANGLCLRFGPLRMYMGSVANPRCKKGFSVDVSEPVYHPGVMFNKLYMLSSYEEIDECSKPIQIGYSLDTDSKVIIIGRPYSLGRILSRQLVNLADKKLVHDVAKKLKTNATLLVQKLERCPVRAGDLMIQDGQLYGIAGYQFNNLAVFADLNSVKNDIREIDADALIENKLM